ncbi:hypothetical protein IMZ31_01775 [Pontibacillus sp. ALD_SL1]|uniref:hypothetical protein n=1 Tax=Pontibacillus sp. ALD_SL1 TaxID=2777185 RepID=UPI001A97754E|nr:hypothetical protein [Pontibacillus sp. ALD_SL1]QST00355.1 hypothetical protein IMZ31_01775 [Pontibacillus sp. ALD_SL1]
MNFFQGIWGIVLGLCFLFFFVLGAVGMTVLLKRAFLERSKVKYGLCIYLTAMLVYAVTKLYTVSPLLTLVGLGAFVIVGVITYKKFTIEVSS